mgnify:CR=1 FL=1
MQPTGITVPADREACGAWLAQQHACGSTRVANRRPRMVSSREATGGRQKVRSRPGTQVGCELSIPLPKPSSDTRTTPT